MNRENNIVEHRFKASAFQCQLRQVKKLMRGDLTGNCRASAFIMGIRHLRSFKWNVIQNSSYFFHHFCRYVGKVGLRVNNVFDEPRAGQAVDLRPLTGNPLCFVSCFLHVLRIQAAEIIL